MWEKEDYLQQVKAQVKEKRFKHILGVMETAVELAKAYGADPKKAEIAAILHDFCKEWPLEEMRKILEQHQDLLWLQYSPVLWHAPVATYVVKERFQLEDQEILDSIYYHTTGRAGMSLLEEVIWVADYIEPGRSFDGVEEARKLAKKDIQDAMRFGLKQTIYDLLEREEAIFPLTFEAYNHYSLKKR